MGMMLENVSNELLIKQAQMIEESSTPQQG